MDGYEPEDFSVCETLKSTPSSITGEVGGGWGQLHDKGCPNWPSGFFSIFERYFFSTPRSRRIWWKYAKRLFFY